MKVVKAKDIQSLLSRENLSADASAALTSQLKVLQSAQPQRVRQKQTQRAETKLLALLIPRYGRYECGGEVIPELVPMAHRALRLDAALPRYRIGIELDGIVGHAQLSNGIPNISGFRRDREKDLVLAAAGWHILRVMHNQLIAEPELLINALTHLINTRSRQDCELDLTGTYPRIVVNA